MEINYIVEVSGGFATYTHSNVLRAQIADAIVAGESIGKIYKRVPAGYTAGKFVPITIDQLKSESK